MILEPVFDAVLMKIVFKVAGKSHNTLFRCELSQANAALISELEKELNNLQDSKQVKKTQIEKIKK